MQSRNSFNINSGGPNPFSSLKSLLLFAGALMLMFFIVSGFVKILYYVAPVLLVVTLFINYRVVANYALGLVDTFRRDVLMGSAKVLFTFFCYPFVIGWLFVKALLFNKMEKIQNEFQSQMGEKTNRNIGDQYADYEEVSSEIGEDSKQKQEPIKIIELPKPKEKDKNNPYDNLFDA